MSFQITTAFSQQYANNVQLLAQQKGSRLRKAVMVNNYTGKAAKMVEQIGKVTAVQLTSRHSDTPLISTPHDARWVFPKSWVANDLIDDADKVQMIIDPQSPYSMNFAYALGRAMDVEIITQALGTNKTGADGTTSTSFTAANIVASGSTGLTVDKLRTAKKLIMAADVDIENEELFCALTAKQHDDLLALTQVVSTDFNEKPVLVDGRVQRFLGFTFIHSEQLPTTSGERQVLCWAKSGLALGIWGDIETKITERPDKNYSTQVFARAHFGGTRTEEAKVVQLLCAES